MEYKYLFGPVPSRRLGFSLGVDLVQHKTCTLNCIFCQLGPTAVTTLERREYVPTEAVKAELADWLKSGEQADAITLAGSGEPTLHTGFGEILRFLAEHAKPPRILMSNGTLFHLPEVRAGAAAADIVKLSLNAWDQPSFERMHRSGPTVLHADMIEGYRLFRQSFKGAIWIEVFLVEGINSALQEAAAIAALVEQIAPDVVHLNTAVRPGGSENAHPLTSSRMEEIAKLFSPRAEIIADFSACQTTLYRISSRRLLGLLQRHPATAEQVASTFGVETAEAAEYLAKLEREGLAQAASAGQGRYYVAVKKP